MLNSRRVVLVLGLAVCCAFAGSTIADGGLTIVGESYAGKVVTVSVANSSAEALVAVIEVTTVQRGILFTATASQRIDSGQTGIVPIELGAITDDIDPLVTNVFLID
jgi:hypothetical protein